MKQHITVEQVNDIHDWTKILINLKLFDDTKIQLGVTDKEIAEQLNIGKMIEVIENEYGDMEIRKCNLISPTWQIEIAGVIKDCDTELCDVLWHTLQELI